MKTQVRKLLNEGIIVKSVTPPKEECDGEIQVDGCFYIQCGFGYYMLWKTDGEKHLLLGDATNFDRLVELLKKELKNGNA